MITVTFTCMRCDVEQVEHDPLALLLPLAMPAGWRFDPELVKLLCPDCVAECATEEDDDV